MIKYNDLNSGFLCQSFHTVFFLYLGFLFVLAGYKKKLARHINKTNIGVFFLLVEHRKKLGSKALLCFVLNETLEVYKLIGLDSGRL